MGGLNFGYAGQGVFTGYSGSVSTMEVQSFAIEPLVYRHDFYS